MCSRSPHAHHGMDRQAAGVSLEFQPLSVRSLHMRAQRDIFGNSRMNIVNAVQLIAMKRVLILCTGNAARSQIAEGLLRHLGGADFDVHSAGTHPAGFVHPLAIETMKERGIDISNHTSKSLSHYDGQSFDYVITVCDEAFQECPHFPGATHQIHWSTPDPSFAPGSDEERQAAFRDTVASLEQRVSALLLQIKNKKAAF